MKRKQRKTENQIPVRHPDRLVFPSVKFTRSEIIEYYRRIAPIILPHLRDRPVTLKRYPDHIHGDAFYEKDAPAFTPKWVKTFPVWRRSGESQIHYIVVNDLQTLIWCASVGTIEFHTFLCRVPDIDRPASIVFDLDPGEGVNILACARVAIILRDLVQQWGLASIVKVSGSKGLQVYIPLNSDVTYAETQPFAHAVAELLASRNPKLITSQMEKTQRRGKVFIDWSQNADYKTTVCAYSIRAKRHHPYVSCPLTWDELERAIVANHADELQFLPSQVLERTASSGDLFEPLLKLHQELPDAARVATKRTRSPSLTRVRHSEEATRRESVQGGRRSFTYDKSSTPLLSINIGDESHTWRFNEPIRERRRNVAHTVDAGFKKTSTAVTGTCEVIDGSYRAGHLDLYFETDDPLLCGEWIFEQAGSEWVFVRANSDEHQVAVPTIKSFEDEPKLAAGKLAAKERAETVEFVQPMECRLAAAVPEGDQWAYELKLDGYRAIAVVRDGRANLYSRQGTLLNHRFRGIVAALAESVPFSCVLDGEIVALNEKGRPSFQLLQNSRSGRAPIIYYLFDVLQRDSIVLRNEPLRMRKQVLDELAQGFKDPIRLSELLPGRGRDILDEIRRLGLEGVIAKNLGSRYEAGKRSGSWIKVRANEREEFVIGGFLPGKSLEAILIGRAENGGLVFIKRVRNGFTPELRSELTRKLKPLITKDCPFANLPETDHRRSAITSAEMHRYVWVKPELRCEVEFAEWTSAGRLRHAAFRQLL